MMPSIEYIDSYFNGDFGPEEKKVFDDRIMDDRVFAEEVAFYLGTLEAARAELVIEKKNRFLELYQPQPEAKINPGRNLWRYAAAAAIIIVAVVGAYNFLKPTTSGQQLATTYISTHFTGMSVQMDDKVNAVQEAKALFNDGKYQQAHQKFDQLVQANPSDEAVLQLAGISALKTGDLDAAATYFSRLQVIPGLHVNYGKFYHGITILKRNRPGDLAAGKKLLQEVIEEGLAGKEEATEFLKHL